MSESSGAIALISNRNSGQNRTRLAEIEALLARYPAIQHFVTSSTQELDEVVATLAGSPLHTLAINGGDGTCSTVVGSLLESGKFPTLPRFAVLPGGTANMNAGDIGVRGPLLKALKRFCEWSCSAQANTDTRIIERQLMQVQISDSNRFHYGMFMGAGAIILGTDYAHESVHSRGLGGDLSLALTTARSAWGILRKDPRFTSSVEVGIRRNGGETETHRAMLLAVSTLERLAFGMRPFWGEGPGGIRCTVVDADCSRFGRTFASILRGKPSRHALTSEHYHSDNADELQLFMQGKINLDGELLTVSDNVRILLSQPLKFLSL